jgi:hypothetical protein
LARAVDTNQLNSLFSFYDLGAMPQSISAETPGKENEVRSLKMFGLAALAVLMAMAFVGASSAMAENTTLCSTDPAGSCTAIAHVHAVSVGKAKLLSSIGTSECNALFSGNVTKAGVDPLVIEGGFTYTNCEFNGGSCTAKEENGPAEIKVSKEGHETAKVTGEGLVHLVCGSSINCSYNGTNLVGTAKGPLLSTQENGEVTLSEQAVTKEVGGLLCPKIAKLDITMSPLSATYLTAESKSVSTTLCNEDPVGTNVCPAGHSLSSVHEVSVGKAKLLTSLGTSECNALFSGNITKAGVDPLVIEGGFTYTNCTFAGSSCTATEENGPAEIKAFKEGHEAVAVTGEGLVHLVCGSSIDCSYNGTGLVGTAKGPLLSTQKNGEVTLTEGATTKETGGFLCPKSAKLDITMSPLSATYITQ